MIQFDSIQCKNNYPLQKLLKPNLQRIFEFYSNTPIPNRLLFRNSAPYQFLYSTLKSTTQFEKCSVSLTYNQNHIIFLLILKSQFNHMDFSNQIFLNAVQNLYSYKLYTMEQHIALLQQSNSLLIQKNIELQKQVIRLKEVKSSAQREQTQTDQQQNPQIRQIRTVKRKYNTRRSNLEKTFKCHFEHCTRKYSSRIALNSHLRKKHHLYSY